MKYVFANKNLKLLFHDPDIFPKDYPREIVKKYVKAIFFIEQARDIRDFYGASGYDFEKL
ncbi:hypothetical protein KBC03_08345 [Patescibacteria group bacterium]|nr:hypothetical protein [Patescibacteria group bacterium]